MSLLRLSSIAGLIATILFLAAACSSSSESPAGGPATDNDAGITPPVDAAPKDPPPRPITDKPPPPQPDKAEVPELTSIAPDKASVGGVGPTIVVTGKNFVPRSVVHLEGVALPTSYTSDTELKATIPSDKIAAVARLKVTVVTPEPGGGTSGDVVFAVENAKPELTALAPLSAVAGAGNTLLTLTGTGFVQGAQVLFGNNALTVTVKSDSVIEATILQSMLLVSTSVPVKVINPVPGGGTSAEIAFTVTSPSAAITTVSPTSIRINASAFELTVNGSGFLVNSAVVFNGTAVPTTFVGSDQLRATIPTTSVAAVGDVPIAVSNAPPTGALSNPVPFSVVYPLPLPSQAAPSALSAGAGPTLITVTGSRFFPASVITFDDVPAATTYVDGTKLTATVPAAQLTTARTMKVKVVNPAPGGGTSTGAENVVISNEKPTITAVNPSAVAMGSGDTLLTVFGTNFVSTSTVKLKGETKPSTYVDGSKITVLAPKALFEMGGTSFTVSVTNPTPGGGTSNTMKVLIQCESSDVNVHMDKTTQELLIDWTTAPKLSRWAAQGGQCPNVPLFPEEQPAYYAIVQNATDATLTLSSWAKCPDDGKGDAFLAVYKQGNIPATDDERKACTGVVSQGGTKYKSPESGGSTFCPGLTKENTGGIALKACERAVLQIQTFDYADPAAHSSPGSIKIKGE